MTRVEPDWKNFKLVPLAELKSDKSIRNFQQYTIYQGLEDPFHVLGLQTGLGKTVCSYATYFYYKTKYPKTKLLIITNKTAVLQFEAELYKFFEYPKEKVISIHEDMSKLGKKKYSDSRHEAYRLWGSTEGVDILIMGYTIFRIDKVAIAAAINKCKKENFHFFLIYDEATAFKNMGTQTFNIVRSFSKAANKILALTATITRGKLEEIYAICKAINIQLMPTKKLFMDSFCITYRLPGRPFVENISGYKNIEAFRDLIRPYITIFRKSDVEDQLPPFTVNKTNLVHSPEQIEIIRSIYAGEMLVERDGFENEWGDNTDIHYFEGITQVGYVKMALLDPRLVLKEDLNNYKILSPKTEEVIRLLSEDFVDEKVVLYTHSRMYLELLNKTITHNKEVPPFYKKVLMIHGGISSRDREKAKELFSNTSDYNLILMNTAGMESINLQAANTMIITTMPATAGALIQLAGRISRIGSQHSNLYLNFLLMENSQDIDEYEIIQQQMLLVGNVLGDAEKGLLDMSVFKSKRDADDLSEADIRSKSMAYLLIKTRRKREIFYRLGK